MARRRIRSIKPALLEDEKACQLSDSAWRLFVSMWVLADDYGNLRAGARYLGGQVWQDTSRDCSAQLDELIKAKMIVVYMNDGQRYASLPKWDKHQRIDNRGKPEVPQPSEPGSAHLASVSPRTCTLGTDSPPLGTASPPLGTDSPLDRIGKDRIGEESEMPADAGLDTGPNQKDLEPIEPPETKAHERYAVAYEAGIELTSGSPFALARSAKAELVAMAVKHAGGRTGDDLLRWFTSTAADYRRATDSEAKYQSGFHPASCLKWLNSRRAPEEQQGTLYPKLKETLSQRHREAAK